MIELALPSKSERCWSPESHTDSSKGAIYQNLCVKCNKPSKYRCPKCSTLSCSLECVNIHKSESGCDGIRDMTAFVPMEEFQDRHLLSDYHFLEDVGRTINNANRTKRTHGITNFLPHNLHRLQLAARHRRTELMILPLPFAKRKISTTYLRYSDRKIFWRIEWKFSQLDVIYTDERIDEETLLGKCLDKYLLPEIPDAGDGKLAYYHSMGHKGVSVLLKDENSPANDTRYFLLKQNKTLRVNFRNKKIIEFPTLLVVPKIHLSCYPH